MPDQASLALLEEVRREVAARKQRQARWVEEAKDHPLEAACRDLLARLPPDQQSPPDPLLYPSLDLQQWALEQPPLDQDKRRESLERLLLAASRVSHQVYLRELLGLVPGDNLEGQVSRLKRLPPLEAGLDLLDLLRSQLG